MAGDMLCVAGASDVGRVRDVNEDSYGFVRGPLGHLLVVCDGMGGHSAGGVASRIALEALLRHFLSLPHGLAAEEAVLTCIEAAQSAVQAKQRDGGSFAKMGTTCALALVDGDHVTVANVGDSRCYLLRSGTLTQLSVDHTKGQRLLDSGLISAEQLTAHPEKSVLYQALGQTGEQRPHVTTKTLQPGDSLMLCSDGVYDRVPDEDLVRIAGVANPFWAAHNLVVHAVEVDGDDNATVVVARALDGRESAAAQPAVKVAPVPAQPPVPARRTTERGPSTSSEGPSWADGRPRTMVSRRRAMMTAVIAGILGVTVGALASGWMGGSNGARTGGEKAKDGAPVDKGHLAPVTRPISKDKSTSPDKSDGGNGALKTVEPSKGPPPASEPSATVTGEGTNEAGADPTNPTGAGPVSSPAPPTNQPTPPSNKNPSSAAPGPDPSGQPPVPPGPSTDGGGLPREPLAFPKEVGRRKPEGSGHMGPEL